MSVLPPLVTTYHPATFNERGVAVPFTSALLAGARLRRVISPPSAAAPRCLLEAVISNPSGGRGVYIVPWPEVRVSFRPTLHDIHIGQAVLSMLQTSEALTPGAIRRIARDVARLGFAGREVARAATIAEFREEARAKAVAAFLVRQLGRNLDLALPPDTDGDVLIAAASARLGRPELALATAIQRVAELCAHCGIGPDTQDAFVPTLVAGLRDLVRDIPATVEQQPTMGAPAGAALVTAAKATIKLAEGSLSATLGRAKRLPELICAFVDNPRAQTLLFEQAEWLLDGWQRICLLWRTAETPQDTAAAISEGLNLIPDLPDEAELWFGLPPRMAAQINGGRKLGAARLRSEPALDSIARNEQLRALAA